MDSDGFVWMKAPARPAEKVREVAAEPLAPEVWAAPTPPEAAPTLRAIGAQLRDGLSAWLRAKVQRASAPRAAQVLSRVVGQLLAGR
ncbi:MAG: hypothetical protein KC731_28985 [Myxococcales bacterium]|nr:hypothetical protein [Myxococcales bacterium]